jgi:Cd2+/Zn2+-exporting ATPase
MGKGAHISKNIVDFQPTNFDATCAGCVERLLKTQPGVLNTAVDCQARSFSIEYDSRIISDERIAHVAHRFAPQLLTQSQSCSGRLNQGSCESCVLRVEKSPLLSPGVRRATASFRDRIVELSFSGVVIASGETAGFGKALAVPGIFAPAERAGAVGESPPAQFSETEKGILRRPEAIFVGATLFLLIAGLLADRYYGRGVLWGALFTGAYFFGGYFGVLGGIESIKHRKIDVDILMVLAALGAAYVGAPFEGAMLLFLFSFSNLLQDLAINRTRKAIRSLMKLRPTEALCRKDGELYRLPLEELQIGDIVIIRPGEAIPLDSVITEGESSLDESSLTGESIPVTKRPGDPVFAGTINQTGGLAVRVSRLARDSTIAKLIRMVEEAQAEKANTQRFLEKAEQIYATGVVLFTVALILVPWLFFNQAFHDVFYRAMTVMVVASPCALIISTPASILSAIGCGARRGVLFKGGAYLEKLARVDTIAFDKTGTLTVGKPRVTDVIAVAGPSSFFPAGSGAQGAAEDILLQLAASVEARSEHPLARAVVDFAKSKRLPLFDCKGFCSYTGRGVIGMLGGRSIAVGNIGLFEEYSAENLEFIRPEISRLHDQGRTVIVIGELPSADLNTVRGLSGDSGREQVTGRACATVLGLVAVADTLRPDVVEVVQKLRSIGVKKIVMLTGDHDRVAQAIGRRAGIDEVFSQLLPEEKVEAIRILKKSGRVAMVGDGINDAPALATANVGIAMGAAGTDVAMETADVVLMSDNLKNIPFALQLSRRSQTIIVENLAFSLAVILVLVVSALGFHLPLPIGVIGHEGSTVLVCLNGLRLLAFRG